MYYNKIVLLYGKKSSLKCIKWFKYPGWYAEKGTKKKSPKEGPLDRKSPEKIPREKKFREEKSPEKRSPEKNPHGKRSSAKKALKKCSLLKECPENITKEDTKKCFYRLIPPNDPTHIKEYSTPTSRSHIHQPVGNARSGTFFRGPFFQGPFFTRIFFPGDHFSRIRCKYTSEPWNKVYMQHIQLLDAKIYFDCIGIYVKYISANISPL